jgi:hypothetical protein
MAITPSGSLTHLTSLIYLVINVRALQKAKSINAGLLVMYELVATLTFVIRQVSPPTTPQVGFPMAHRCSVFGVPTFSPSKIR